MCIHDRSPLITATCTIWSAPESKCKPTNSSSRQQRSFGLVIDYSRPWYSPKRLILLSDWNVREFELFLAKRIVEGCRFFINGQWSRQLRWLIVLFICPEFLRPYPLVTRSFFIGPDTFPVYIETTFPNQWWPAYVFTTTPPIEWRNQRDLELARISIQSVPQAPLPHITATTQISNYLSDGYSLDEFQTLRLSWRKKPAEVMTPYVLTKNRSSQHHNWYVRFTDPVVSHKWGGKGTLLLAIA